MKSRRRILLAGCTAIIIIAPNVSIATLDSILAARVALVFPFEVGQQYEFQSSKTFTRMNGTHLQPFTVETIIVTDTTINGKTWLHVPYWTPFGSEYYRLDDTVRVWNVNLRTGEERIFLDLGYSGERDYPGPEIWCPQNGCFDQMSFHLGAPTWSPNRLGQPFVNLYFGLWGDEEWAARESVVGTGWTIACGLRDGGGIQPEHIAFADSALAYSFYTCCFHYSTMHGEAGPGTVQHRGAANDDVRLIGYFRPASAEPWPALFDGPLAISEEDAFPADLALSVSPNPTNASTVIRAALPGRETMKLAVFSPTGQVVCTLFDGVSDVGTPEFVWDGRDDRGRHVSSGIYIVHLRIGNRSLVRRVAIAR